MRETAGMKARRDAERRALRPLVGAAGGLVTDRLMRAVAGLEGGELQKVVTRLRRRGHAVARVRGEGYFLSTVSRKDLQAAYLPIV